MARESTDPAWLVIRGFFAGLGAFAAVALAVTAVVEGLSGAVVAVLDAHAVPSVAVIPGLPPFTWFGLPPASLYFLPPIALSTAGLLAARFTRSTGVRDGVVAGSPVALGYVPPMVLAGTIADVDAATAGGLALAYAAVFGVIGGFVGVRT